MESWPLYKCTRGRSELVSTCISSLRWFTSPALFDTCTKAVYPATGSSHSCVNCLFFAEEDAEVFSGQTRFKDGGHNRAVELTPMLGNAWNEESESDTQRKLERQAHGRCIIARLDQDRERRGQSEVSSANLVRPSPRTDPGGKTKVVNVYHSW